MSKILQLNDCQSPLIKTILAKLYQEVSLFKPLSTEVYYDDNWDIECIRITAKTGETGLHNLILTVRDVDDRLQIRANSEVSQPKWVQDVEDYINEMMYRS